MGNDSFAPWSTNPNCFIVMNVAPVNKTIFIFQYPINHGASRDLLRIPGVAESDIRASLLKGELNHKIRASEIVITCSDIDLTQYNSTTLAFLQAAGVVNGLGPGGGGGITPFEHETLRQLIHFVDNGPGDGFASGAVRITNPPGDPFPTSITWYLDATQTTKLVEKLIVYNSSQSPTTITWHMYDFDGVTIVHTVVDSFTYINGVFETKRVRAIS